MRRLAAGTWDRRTDHLPYAVLDVETDGLRGGLLWWTISCECTTPAVVRGRDAETLWRTILSHNSHGHSWREHVWWAHNGGDYDYLYLLPPARDDVRERAAVVTPITRADAVIGWRVQRSKHRTDLRDSYALLPASLASLTAQLAPELPKLDIGLKAGVTFDPANAEHVAYADRDAVALVAVLVRYRELLQEAWGVLPSWSAASTALRAWRAGLGEMSYGHPPEAAALLARAGYYGGMVPVRDTNLRADLVTVDYNSMYPFVMREAGVPDGPCWPVHRYVPGRPAFYRVIAEIDAGAPWTMLPYRDPGGALAWPTGRFVTTVTSDEYARALQLGYRLTVLDGWAWQSIAYPFGSFVDEIERMRARGGPLAYVGKITGNSLYGKFGSRPEHDDWRLTADRPGPDWYPPAFDTASDPERYECLWVRRGAKLTADYLMPHWSAWITAHARLLLDDLAAAVGYEHVVYGDTDSLTFPAERLDRVADRIGTAFGQVKVEHRWTWYRAHAPKVYEGMDGGVRVARAKGIPRALIETAYETGAVAWDSPNGSIAVLQGAEMVTPRRRSISSLDHSIAWRRRDDGTVAPVHLAS